MRKVLPLFIVLLTIPVMAQSPAPAQNSKSLASNVNEGENAKKARAILQQMVEALGGSSYLGIQDMSQEGRSYSYAQGRPNSVGLLFWRFWKAPDKDRVELTKKRDVVYINVGDKGYDVSYKGTAAQEPERLRDYLRQRDHSLERVIKVWLQDPATALFYDGPAVAEQKHCDSVTLMNAKNDSVTIFVDTNNHLPVKKTYVWRDPMDNLKNEEGEIYDNFRVVQGVMTPHTTLRTHNGDTINQRFIASVKYNTGLPDSMFDTTVTYDPYKHSGPRQ